MLRKKLLARLGLLVVGFVAGAVVSIVLLQGVLRDLDQMNSDAAALIDGVQDLSTAIAAVEDESGAGRAVEDTMRMVQTKARALGTHRVFSDGGSAAAEYVRVGELVDAASAASAEGRAAALAGLRSAVLEAGKSARSFVAQEQAALAGRLRWLVIGLTAAAILMVNVTCMVLLGTAAMILRPVGKLVEMCRGLGEEKFDQRVEIEGGDEFGELAHAYNSMAEELGALEGRKVQAMRHLAVTLNHELLNIISSIDMQLRLVDRKSGSDPAMAERLRDIHESLGRLAKTIASLRNVRRVVLTEYLPGEMMLDLPLSVADESTGAERHSAAAGGVNS